MKSESFIHFLTVTQNKGCISCPNLEYVHTRVIETKTYLSNLQDHVFSVLLYFISFEKKVLVMIPK